MGDLEHKDGIYTDRLTKVEYESLTEHIVTGGALNEFLIVQADGTLAHKTAVEAFAAGAGVIYYTPIFVTEDTNYDRVGVEVTIGAAGSAEIWLYEWDDGLPGDKIADLGDVADTTNVVLNQVVINLNLVGGTYYFLAIRCTGTPTLNGVDDRSCSLIPVPSVSAGFRTPGTIMTVTAALADPAPAPTGITSIGYATLGLRES